LAVWDGRLSKGALDSRAPFLLGWTFQRIYGNPAEIIKPDVKTMCACQLTIFTEDTKKAPEMHFGASVGVELRLEDEFGRDLNLPGACRAIGAGQGRSRKAKGSGSRNAVAWLAELWVVKEIVEFEPQLQLDVLGNGCVFQQRRVDVDLVRPIKGILPRFDC